MHHLELLTPPAAFDLSTVELMQASDRLPKADAGVLAKLISAASRAIASELGAEAGLGWAKYSYHTSGRNRTKIGLPVRPVGLVESVLVDEEPYTAFKLDKRAGKLWTPEGWSSEQMYGGWLEARPIAAGQRPVDLVVTCWAGWWLPGQDQEAIPAGAAALDGVLERCCWLAVKESYLGDKRDARLSSYTNTYSQGDTGGATTSLSYAATATPLALPPEVYALLAPYYWRGPA